MCDLEGEDGGHSSLRLLFPLTLFFVLPVGGVVLYIYVSVEENTGRRSFEKRRKDRVESFLASVELMS